MRNGSPFVVPSAMSKSAVHAMTMSLATEWGRYGIRLNAIAPGEIPTEGMSKRLNPNDQPGARTIKVNPLGRIGTMEELSNLATFSLTASSVEARRDHVQRATVRRVVGKCRPGVPLDHTMAVSGSAIALIASSASSHASRKSTIYLTIAEVVSPDAFSVSA